MTIRLFRWFGLALLSVAVLSIGGWCTLVIWFRLPATEWVRGGFATMFLVLTLVTTAYLATLRRWVVLAAYACLCAVVLAWWTTIRPTNDRDWAPMLRGALPGPSRVIA